MEVCTSTEVFVDESLADLAVDLSQQQNADVAHLWQSASRETSLRLARLGKSPSASLSSWAAKAIISTQSSSSVKHQALTRPKSKRLLSTPSTKH